MPDNFIKAYSVRWLTNGQHLALAQRSQAVVQLDFVLTDFFEQEKIVKKLKNKLPLILNLSADKIVIGKIKQAGLVLLNGQTISLVANVHLHNLSVFNWHEAIIPLSHDISDLLKPADRIFINHGQVILIVNSIEKSIIRVKVSRGGKISTGDQVLAPGLVFDFGFNQELAEKIKKLQPDYFSIPLNRYKKVLQAKKIVGKVSSKFILRISQLKQLAYLSETITLADGLLVDLRSLSLEMPQAKLEFLQKKLIVLAKEKDKIIIVYGLLPKNESS